MVKGGSLLKEEVLSYRFQRLDGGYSTLREFDSEIYLLYFFSSYCIPCVKDIAFLNEHRAFYNRGKVTVIGVGMDYNGATTLKPFAEYNNIWFPVMLVDKNILEGNWLFGKITTIPTTILINRKEKRYLIHTGNLSDDIIKQIE